MFAAFFIVESGARFELYETTKLNRRISNASARSLNLDKISRTLEIEDEKILER